MTDAALPFIAFWVAAGLILYTYAGYPLALWLLGLGRRPPAAEDPESWPTISLVVAAYNEASVLREKLENSFALDYPADCLQIIVVSDGSMDGTDDVAREYEARAGYVFLRQEHNAGKTMAQNAGVRAATGQLLVFSDANSIYQADALQHLVRPFVDPRVGCVCGELRYTNPRRAGAGKGEGSYWRYEQYLKRRESLLGSLVGANGSIYALRRELFEELGPAIISDFIMPIRVRLRGQRVIYEPRAVAHEESAHGFVDEFRRRRRIVARSWYGLWTQPAVLNVFARPLFTFQVVSHKVVRWLVPVLLLVVLGASGVLAADGAAAYAVLLGVQLVLYGLAAVGLVFPGGPGRIGLFYVPAYFCAINAGALLGTWNALTGRRHTVWKPVARPEEG